MKKKNVIALSLAAVLTLGLLTACGGKKDQETVVKVGVVGTQNDQWKTVNELLAKDNIKCEMVEYTAYNMPNDALNAGEVDLNAFQHKAYLNNEIDAQGYDITVLGDTIIAPLSVYSDKIASLDELKEGDKIAVPQDPTNEGRCFKILESAGVIEVDPAAGYVPELKDITANPLNLEFIEVEAAYTASQISDPEVAAAFVNGAHAVDNGLNIADAIYTEQVEPGSDNPYINIIACRTADVENETYQKVLAAYQTAETAKAIEEIFKGTYLPAFEY
ncbi:MAG: MetQ/NlpA family ABC transporter substrate-binding protein [Oscillospiraceae bacterium]|jgi:D-methionine transport system substrate-binding protein|nr:MetQ/NlpA family ABC transporter substrate-binding protein [Oscillospiraceae bacterium]